MYPIFWVGFVLFVVRKIWKLAWNVVAAKNTGLPYILTPALETEIIGQILDPLLRRVYRKSLVQGHGWPRWCRYMIREWAWEDRRQTHERLGELFIVVSPEGIICYSCDSVCNADVTSRRLEFVKPQDKYKLLAIFGPNLATVEGDTFKTHSRVTASAFSDRSGAETMVWKETRRHANSLIKDWVNGSSAGFLSDITALTLAVFLRAGYGQDVSWDSLRNRDQPTAPGKEKTLSLHESMAKTLQQIFLIVLLPRRLITLLAPETAQAYWGLRSNLAGLIELERASALQVADEPAQQTLLASIVRASIDSAGFSHSSGTKTGALSEEEILGNLFIFLIGGIETTSNSISFGLLVLALFPEIQKRLIEAVDRLVVTEETGGAPLNMHNDSEDMRLLLGFMYEIFRLFPGVLWITKMVKEPTRVSITPITKGGPNQVQLPAECRMYLNVSATQTWPRYWSDPDKFDPTRWKKFADKDPLRKLNGTFLGFSDGARACPGRRLAYAEFVAFFVALLRKHAVYLPPDLNEVTVRRDLSMTSAGALTLSPPAYMRVTLELHEQFRARHTALN